ncbi:MAG: type II toxin-antitoxin system RelE/ParE family toxin [Marinoscillum sp.]|uniref:type II toxin-antitoxin system RelE/ParE family toxin n=1 Tax=Marinoscillum sp. TaxID=2024838 RepID=UPI0032FAC4C6
MEKKFEIKLLEEAFSFIKSQNNKVQDKIFYNIRKAQILNDPKLFKKLNQNIWEFRTKYAGLQYRILAFWDKENNEMTLVCGTHGFVKKTDKVSSQEIEKAEQMRVEYFEQKIKKDENI